MSTRIVLCMFALAIAGCPIGPKPADFGPAGMRVELSLTKSLPLAPPGVEADLSGELLSADSSGLVVRLETMEANRLRSKILRIEYAVISSGKVQRTQARPGPKPPTPDDLARLRQVSRYPQGISHELMAKLLGAYGQDSLLRVSR